MTTNFFRDPWAQAQQLGAMNGGQPGQWVSWIRNLLQQPGPTDAQRSQVLADQEQQNANDARRRQAWAAQGGSGYPPPDFMPDGGGGSGPRNASPLPQATDEETQLRAALKAAGVSDALIEQAILDLRGGKYTAAQIREAAGLGGDNAEAAAGGEGTFTGREAREGIESERGLEFGESFQDYVASNLPPFLAPQALTALNRRRDPLEAKFLAGQALGSIPLETTIRDFIANNFNMGNATQGVGDVFNQFKQLGGLLNASEVDPRAASAALPFAAPETQAFTVSNLLGQTIAPHLRSGLNSVINRDFSRFRAPGGGEDANYFADFMRRYGTQ